MKCERAINEDGLLYVPFAEVKQQEQEIKQKLEVYKKALELACERIMEAELNSFCEFKCDKCKYYPNDCVSHTKANIEYYLQKAREEE